MSICTSPAHTSSLTSASTCVHLRENKKEILLSVFQIFNVTHGGLHVVAWFVVEWERSGVVIRAVSQGPVRSAVGKRTRFAIRRQPVHLFFFFQERELHLDFNCKTKDTSPSEIARMNKCSVIVSPSHNKLLTALITSGLHHYSYIPVLSCFISTPLQCFGRVICLSAWGDVHKSGTN